MNRQMPLWRTFESSIMWVFMVLMIDFGEHSSLNKVICTQQINKTLITMSILYSNMCNMYLLDCFLFPHPIVKWAAFNKSWRCWTNFDRCKYSHLCRVILDSWWSNSSRRPCSPYWSGNNELKFYGWLFTSICSFTLFACWNVTSIKILFSNIL